MGRSLAVFAAIVAGVVNPVQRAGVATSYDLVVTSVTWNPAPPTAGDHLVFSATVKNVGASSTTAGLSWRLSFSVDGVTTNWMTTTATLPAGATVTLMASSGRERVNYWTAAAGAHIVGATADDQNRLGRELSETNNRRMASLTVGSRSAPDCRGTSTVKIGPTRGGLTGFANGFRYGQLTATDRTTYMDSFAATGAKWYRMNMENWDINEFQDVVAKAKARGLCVIGNLNANPTGTHWADPPDHQAWANHVAATYVTALEGDVNVWEVWNEPNLTGFWPGTSDSYADLLHRTYLAIHAVDPDAVVLGAGLAPAGGATDSRNAVNFWTRVYDWNRAQGRQGSAGLFDALGHHPYLYPEDPLAPANATTDGNAFDQTRLIHDLMADPAYGGPTNDGAKRIWATEAGFPTGCSSSGCITLSEGATRVPAQLDKWINEWGGFTGPMLFHQLQEQPGVTDVEHYFGFIRGDWSPKNPMYSAFTNYAARTD